jgi:hypothetical protein
VVHEDGKGTFEVTCVEDEYFPPTRSGKGAHFELKYGATHSHKHDDKVGPQIAAFQNLDSLPSRLHRCLKGNAVYTLKCSF